jgi:hypothetical protein
MGIRDNQEVYIPFVRLMRQRPLTWQQVDDAAVNGWSVDFHGDNFEQDASGAWVSLGDGDCDPYYNGQDYLELNYGRQKGTLRVGSLGESPSDARIDDNPGGGGSDSTYVDGITAKVMYFEVNAFCSDGLNQGEWIGRVKWRWECHPGMLATITVLEVDPKAKPTAEFKAALLEFCQDRSFTFPEVEPPLEGGTACQGEFCFGGSPYLSKVARPNPPRRRQP